MKKISRREFLAVSGKLALGGFLFYFLPVQVFYKQSSKLWPYIDTKPFLKSDLYKKHNLAG